MAVTLARRFCPLRFAPLFIKIDKPKLPLGLYFSLICNAYATDMIRVTAIVLALAVSFDYVMLGGKYTNAAQQIFFAILYRAH
jgi:hypothetical protein